MSRTGIAIVFGSSSVTAEPAEELQGRLQRLGAVYVLDFSSTDGVGKSLAIHGFIFTHRLLCLMHLLTITGSVGMAGDPGFLDLEKGNRHAAEIRNLAGPFVLAPAPGRFASPTHILGHMSATVAQEHGLAASGQSRRQRLPSSMVVAVMSGAARRYGSVAQRFRKRMTRARNKSATFVSAIPGSNTAKHTAAFLTSTSSAYRTGDVHQLARLSWLTSDRISRKRSANAARHVLRREGRKFGPLAATSRTL
jgi:hypothetical protein